MYIRVRGRAYIIYNVEYAYIQTYKTFFKKIKKSAFKRLTGVYKFDIISRLCKNACIGLMREVTANPKQKAALADNFR